MSVLSDGVWILSSVCMTLDRGSEEKKMVPRSKSVDTETVCEDKDEGTKF